MAVAENDLQAQKPTTGLYVILFYQPVGREQVLVSFIIFKQTLLFPPFMYLYIYIYEGDGIR